jgi:hypothetical protein
VHCDSAIAHDLATREIERRWAGEPAKGDTNPVAQRSAQRGPRSAPRGRLHHPGRSPRPHPPRDGGPLHAARANPPAE